jgi:glyoxylase-like metal-dependent hydrolase (beta-lactamase superfamily II)
MAGLMVEVVPVTPLAQNCTLLWDSAAPAAVVIDPGGDAPRIVAALARRGLSAQAIWLTHGHLDHAGGAEALRQALGGAIAVIGPHRADQFLLDSIATQAAQYGLTGMENAAPDQWLEEGDALTLGDHRFEVLHCPGHSPGSVAFVNRAARFAQVGDALFAGSVGRTDFPYGDHATLIAAIKTKLLPLGDDMRFICGHGPGSTFGRERVSNPFLT